jgi:hypothetical protein
MNPISPRRLPSPPNRTATRLIVVTTPIGKAASPRTRLKTENPLGPTADGDSSAASAFPEESAVTGSTADVVCDVEAGEAVGSRLLPHF